MVATYRAFCEHGYADLTMRDIAAEFEKSRSLLHYHYDTKEDLLVAMLEYLAARYVGALEPRTDDPAAALAAFLDDSLFGTAAGTPRDEPFAFAEFHTALLELRALAHRNEAFREQLLASYEAVRGAVADIVAAGVDQGVFRPVDPDAYATVLVDAVDAARTRSLTLAADDEAVRAAARDNLARYLLEPILVESGKGQTASVGSEAED